MEEPLKIMAGTQGTYILNDTTAYVGTMDGFVTLEDTIISSILQDGNDVIASYISDPAGIVKAGAIIRPINDGGTGKVNKFDSIQLISGSVAIIR
jgi:7-keto-8-aminopelargonate synthetase-like enzyme